MKEREKGGKGEENEGTGSGKETERKGKVKKKEEKERRNEGKGRDMTGKEGKAREMEREWWGREGGLRRYSLVKIYSSGFNQILISFSFERYYYDFD